MMGSIGFWILMILAVTRPQSAIRDPKSQGACSSVWLERTPDKREVDGSTPSRPTNRFGGVAQLGERLPCTQEAIGSNPFTSTIFCCEKKNAGRCKVRKMSLRYFTDFLTFGIEGSIFDN